MADLAERPPLPQAQQERPIFIVTLGDFAIFVYEELADWYDASAGRRQLRRGCARLVAQLDQLVRKSAFAVAAGGRSEGNQRHVWSGLRRCMRRWGMAEALIVRDATLMLRRHPTCHIDTDLLKEQLAAAQDARAGGRLRQAIDLLREALPLCGGDYLPIFDEPLPRWLALARKEWHVAQNEIWCLLGCCYLELEPPHCEAALAIAREALHRDPDYIPFHELAARAARCCGYDELSELYER